MQKQEIKNNPLAFSYSLFKKGDNIILKKAFTLVELIIVITILAILATIAFVSFSNYTKSARDANRVTTLGNMEKGLQTFFIRTGKYPLPDNPITITASGETLGYQGDLGESVLRLIQSQKEVLDPETGEFYPYRTSHSMKHYQLLGFLENQISANILLSDVYASEMRFPKLLGDNLGIITYPDGKNIRNDIDILSYNGPELNVYLKNNVVLSGTGSELIKIHPQGSCDRIFELNNNLLSGTYNIFHNNITLPVYCHKDFPTQNFYNFIVDSDFENQDEENWQIMHSPFSATNLRKTSQSAYAGNNGLQVDGYFEFQSKYFTYVDPTKRYRISGDFRSAGSQGSRLYYGFVEYDKDFKPIINYHVNVVPDTETILINDISSGDTQIVFENSGNTCDAWGFATYFNNHTFIAFDVDDSGNYNDLPNRNLSSAGGFASIVNNGGSCTLTLNQPVGVDYPAGTKIRRHNSGSSYNYVAAGGELVPNSWTEYNGVINGVSRSGVDPQYFRRGTQFVKVLFIGNYLQSSDAILYIDNLSLEEF